MKPELYYPAKPYSVTQAWGVHRPDVYSQFGFTDHNGVDFRLGTDKNIYAPFECEVYNTGNHPTGSGIFVSLLSKNKYIFPDGIEGNILVDYLHLDHPLVKTGDRLKIGSTVAKADNTGFSTGPHTHGQYRRILPLIEGFHELDVNQANNSFDPDPFFNGLHASDQRTFTMILSELSIIIKALGKLLTK